MRVASFGSIVFASLLTAAPAFAAEAALPLDGAKADVGATKAAICGACHGPTGNSVNPEWPNLAGQSPTYIYEQLHLFKKDVRVNPVMKPILDTVNEADYKDLAVYFATQTPTGLEADPSYWKAGEKLYRKGDPARQIPACAACHGPLGRGNLAAAYPALRAQHSVYTVKQLQDYLTKNRYRDASDANTVYTTRNSVMMTTIAARLSPEDIRNLASYLQGLR